MGSHGCRPARRRGVAMLLVLIAVAAVLVISMGYLVEQSLSIALARNIDERASARAIAESGLEIALTYVLTNENWRIQQTEGVWCQDRPLSGGTFTVRGWDGWDADGDGVIDGDGDFTNNTLDFLTLACEGRYKSVVCSVRAVVFPHKTVLMIVPNAGSLTVEGASRRDLLRSWGWKVTLCSQNATAATFEAAAAGAHVVYFPAHAALMDPIKTKLKSLALPVVLENAQLVKELRLADNSSKEYVGSVIKIPQLTRMVTDDFGVPVTETYTHYVTAPFAIGDLTVCNSDSKLLRLDGKLAAGLDVLAVKFNETNRVTLGVLDAGGLARDGKPARATRIALPWGGSDFSILALNADGQSILRRSMDYAGSGWTGLLPGVVVYDKIEIVGSSGLDGFDPSLGPYGPSNNNANATISTNSLSDKKIYVARDANLRGNPYVTADANADKVIVADGTMTGTRRKMPSAVPIPVPLPPDEMPASSGNLACTSGMTVLSADQRVDKLTVTGTAILRIQGDVTIQCDDDVRIEQQGQIQLLPNSSLTIFTKRNVQIKNDARVNVNSADPSCLNWILLADTLQLTDNAQMYGAVRSYGGVLNVKETAQMFGTFIGKSVKLEHSARLHVDTLNSGTVVTLGRSVDLRLVTARQLRWLD